MKRWLTLELKINVCSFPSILKSLQSHGMIHFSLIQWTVWGTYSGPDLVLGAGDPTLWSLPSIVVSNFNHKASGFSVINLPEKEEKSLLGRNAIRARIPGMHKRADWEDISERKHRSMKQLEVFWELQVLSEWVKERER